MPKKTVLPLLILVVTVALIPVSGARGSEPPELTPRYYLPLVLGRPSQGECQAEVEPNETHTAVDHIPTDVIVCDWHYNRMKDYPSVRFFQEKGFRVWPASWRSPSAARALAACSQQDGTDRMLGHLCTSWCGMRNYCQALLGENTAELPENAIRAAATFNAMADVWR